MTLNRGIAILVAAVLLAGIAADTLLAQSSRAGTAPAPSGGHVMALSGTYPNAGGILSGPFTPPVREIFALQYDGIRRWVWAGTESSRSHAGRADLYMLDHTNGMAVMSSIVTDEMGVTGSAAPLIDGPVDELALLGNGDLLCADYNGDQLRFDDTLFLLSAAGRTTLAGVWYLDDACAPGKCAKNTNTNIPQDRIDGVAGLAVRQTVSIAGGNQTTQHVFVGQYLASAVIRRVELTPGTPGTWATRQIYASPTGGSVDGMDWDADLQSFWMTSVATGLIYEVELDRVAASFRVIQVFPSQGIAGPMAVTAIRRSTGPHQIIEGEGFSLNGSIHVLDTGHTEGRGRAGVDDRVGYGPITVVALFDPDCAGMPFRVLASFGRAAIPIGDRYLELAPDPLLTWSLLDTQFVGAVDASGAARLTLPLNLPPLVGPLHFQVAVIDSPAINYLGVKRLTPVVSHMTL